MYPFGSTKTSAIIFESPNWSPTESEWASRFGHTPNLQNDCLKSSDDLEENERGKRTCLSKVNSGVCTLDAHLFYLCHINGRIQSLPSKSLTTTWFLSLKFKSNQNTDRHICFGFFFQVSRIFVIFFVCFGSPRCFFSSLLFFVIDRFNLTLLSCLRYLHMTVANVEYIYYFQRRQWKPKWLHNPCILSCVWLLLFWRTNISIYRVFSSSCNPKK